MHLVIDPHSGEHAPIRPLVNTQSFDVVFFEFTLVDRAVSPLESSMAVLFAVLIIPLV
jgi:hypothetical protein